MNLLHLLTLLFVAAARRVHLSDDEDVQKLEKNIICGSYEVCKCQMTSDDSVATCLANTCTFAPTAPFFCCTEGGWWCSGAQCDSQITSWEDCEWANFPSEDTEQRVGGVYPGEGLYVDLPAITPKSSSRGAYVLTDVDDTIKCSGGPPAGADTVCSGTSPHNMYPGVAEFALALARGPNDSTTPPKVVPLSARPDELSAFLAMRDDTPEGQAYANAASSQNISGWGLDVDNAQYGSGLDLTDFHVDTDLTGFDKMGFRKYNNWKSIKGNFGGVSFFIGDNGQGDVVAAEMMLKRSHALQDSQGALRAAFIHDALRRCSSSSCKSTWATYGIFFFANYVDAAGQAKNLGLISRVGCQTVCVAAPSFSCTC